MAKVPLAGRMPRRVSLVAQAAEALRESIHAGRWRVELPGEMELCETLHISRVTLRAALRELEREGLLTSGQGKRRRIRAPKAGHRKVPVSKSILMVSPQPLHRLSPTTLFWVDALRKDLGEAGYELDVHASEAAYAGEPELWLPRWLVEANPAALLLYRTTPAMQRWFVACGRPGVIAGSRHEGVALPSVDLDYAATCRHAVGRLTAHGHVRLAFLLPRSTLAGDLDSERGFREGVERAGNAEATGSVIHHDGTPGGICAALDAARRQTPCPTAFLIAHAAHVLTAVGHLLRSGLRFPREVALISRDDDPFLEHVVPRVTRYSVDATRFARQISRLVLQMACAGPVPCRDHRLMPRLVSGETLG